jgi:hypothetical protein
MASGERESLRSEVIDGTLSIPGHPGDWLHDAHRDRQRAVQMVHDQGRFVLALGTGGVPRSRPSHTDHGPVPELMGRIAAYGRKIHDPRD